MKSEYDPTYPLRIVEIRSNLGGAEALYEAASTVFALPPLSTLQDAQGDLNFISDEIEEWLEDPKFSLFCPRVLLYPHGQGWVVWTAASGRVVDLDGHYCTVQFGSAGSAVAASAILNHLAKHDMLGWVTVTAVDANGRTFQYRGAEFPIGALETEAQAAT